MILSTERKFGKNEIIIKVFLHLIIKNALLISIPKGPIERRTKNEVFN